MILSLALVMSLYELFELGAKKNSSKQAICFCNGDENLVLSYSELALSSQKVSHLSLSMKSIVTTHNDNNIVDF